MQRGVHGRLMDNSTSVREAAVELLGRFVLSRPQLTEQYYDMLIERILVRCSQVSRNAFAIQQHLCCVQQLFTCKHICGYFQPGGSFELCSLLRLWWHRRKSIWLKWRSWSSAIVDLVICLQDLLCLELRMWWLNSWLFWLFFLKNNLSPLGVCCRVSRCLKLL